MVKPNSRVELDYTSKIDTEDFSLAYIDYNKDNHIHQHYEVLVNSDEAWDIKNQVKEIRNINKNIEFSVILDKLHYNFNDLIETDEIYTDLKKGLHPKQEEIKDFFGANDLERNILYIIVNGEINFPESFIDKKHKHFKDLIIEEISNLTIDTKGNSRQYSPKEIKDIIEENNIKIYPEKEHDHDQVTRIVNELEKIIPIKKKLQIKEGDAHFLEKQEEEA